MTLPSLQDLEDAAAIVYRVLAPTPQICWPQLCVRAGTEVWVKHENHMRSGPSKSAAAWFMWRNSNSASPGWPG
jgi:threonine dehydratase